jgi:hypothetical protein
MSMVARIALLATALLAAPLVATSALATPFAVRLGEARIALDTPPGFSDAAFTGSPRVLEMAESLTSASNRVLLFAITDADLRRFTVGDTPELRQYMIVVTPRSLERRQVSVNDFERYVADLTRGLGEPPPGITDFRTFLADRPPGQPTLLAELRREPALLSILQGARLSAEEKEFWWEKSEPGYYLLSTTTLLRLRERALSLSVFTGYTSPADLEWLKLTTQRWVEELLRLNRR